MTTWREYEAVLDKASLSQGDLVTFENAVGISRFGVVVTADCDIDHRKHSRVITFVSLVTIKTIISECLTIDYLEKVDEPLRGWLGKCLGIEIPTTDSTFPAVVKAETKSRNLPDSQLLAARSISHDLERVEISQLVTLLSEAGLKSTGFGMKFASQIADRGDLLLLPEKPPTIAEPLRVIWLRQVWQKPVATIALRNSELENAEGMRVARLRSPFRYRMTQQFAQVFSDIGLPNTDHKALTSDVEEAIA